MSTTTMTGINTVQHIVQNLNTPVRADEGNEDNLIDPKAVVELREIETRMVRQVYRERSVSFVAELFFPSAKSEASSGSWDWNETNPDSPLNISSIFPSTISETNDSSPEFSRSNSDSIMSIFLPATSPKDSPENYEISARSRSIPSYSIMSIFPPTLSEIDSPDNSEIIFRNPSIPSYYHFFPPDRSDTDSYGSSTPDHQLSIPSLYFPTNNSETINSRLVSNGISLDERILGGIEKMDKCIQAVDILQSFPSLTAAVNVAVTVEEKGGGGGGGGGGGRRSSSATDDSQDVSYHGPERVRVRQYGKSCKELSGLYKSQEIQAHNGSIWSIKFSLDGKYLASAGEDCDIHVWQVVESERKGDLLSMERQDDVNFNYLFVPNGSPEPNSLSPIMDSPLEKKKRGRTSVSRKSLSLDRILVPETVFALSDKPICSFQGHSDDVLDLSWSKSQHLLSSSMDKTVRLWHLPSKSCLKVFSHSDFVTCIQFNPVDDRYFISGSLDAKVRIWSIPDRQVVDWNDVHEMVTAACYTPDGQGALVGSHKGSCCLYNTSENKLQQKSQINLQNKKKKSHHKKISGFQFAPGSSSEVLVTSADSRIRVVDGTDLVHKFKGFRNTNSQISASLTANGKFVVSASEDSYVYVWKQEADSRPSRSKGVNVTRSYELFHCQDVSVAIPWPGMADTWGLQDDCCVDQNGLDNNLDNIDEVSTANHPPTPVEDINDGSRSASGCTNSPLHGTISSATNGYFFDRISATWPEEKLVLPTRNRSSPCVSVDGLTQNASAWGMVIVTAGRKGQIRTFQNFGLPVRI